MAPVKYKIYSLYADKSANLLMQNCASYFRRINQSYSYCRLCMCKLFAGLHVKLKQFSQCLYYSDSAPIATKAALWVRIQEALKKQNKATKKCHYCPLKTMVEIEPG